MLKKLEVILKTAERCNINCTYCYFFNGEDTSYLKHPPHIKNPIIEGIVAFLKTGLKNIRCEELQIDFHGGEPMLQRKSTFDAMCSLFRSELSPLTNLTLAIQTNATLVDNEWIELFHKHQIHVGVSIDGPKEYNDLARVDFKGKGTYDATAKGIKQLVEAAAQGKIKKISTLTVINPSFSAKKIYQHLRDELGIHSMDFLLPDISYEKMPEHTFNTGYSAKDYGVFLSELFNEFIKDYDSKTRIRILNSILSLFLGGKSQLMDFGPEESLYKAFTISSNGELCPDDVLRSANPLLMQMGRTVFNTDLTTFLDDSIFKALEDAKKILPTDCQSCHWQNVCGGGMQIHRYSKSNKFNNPSSMCEGLKEIYSHISTYILSHGYDSSKLLATLGI